MTAQTDIEEAAVTCYKSVFRVFVFWGILLSCLYVRRQEVWCDQIIPEIQTEAALQGDVNSMNDGDLTLVQATDLHFIAPELTDHGQYFENMIEKADGKVMNYSNELAEAFVEEMLTLAPDAVILSGDVSFNGARRSHEVLAEKLRRISEAGIPVLLIPGNHDIEYSQAAKFSGDTFTRVASVTENEFGQIYNGLDGESVIARDPSSLSMVAQLSGGWRILLVDTNTVSSANSVSENTLLWVEQQLQNAQQAGAQVISVTHQTLLIHNSMFVGGFQVRNASELVDLYEKYHVHVNLCGHMHLQHITTENGLTDIVTSSLAITPAQYGRMEISEGGQSFNYRTQSVDVSAWAEKQGTEDPDLLHFTEYAKKFFWDSSYRKGLSSAGNADNARLLAAYSADLNTAYFTGTMDSFSWNEELTKNWEQIDPLYGAYFRSVSSELGTNHNMTQVQLSDGRDSD